MVPIIITGIGWREFKNHIVKLLLKLKIVLPLSWASGKRLSRSACRTRWVRPTDAAWELLLLPLLLLVSQWRRYNPREIRREGHWPPVSVRNNNIIIIIPSYIIDSYCAYNTFGARRRPRYRGDFTIIIIL